MQDLSITPPFIHSNAQVGHYLEQQVKQSLIGRHVAWIKEPHEGLSKIGINALVAFESLCLVLTGIGLFLVIKAHLISTKLDIYAKLKNDITLYNPPPDTPIPFKTHTYAFNHTHDFAIHENKLWCRGRNSSENGQWKMLYFDEYGSDNPPQELRVDGCNLMVKDKEGYIHYKKILEESRSILSGKYKATDVTLEDRWETAWFSFPLIELFYHLFHSKKLQIPQDAKGWAMSHRGDFNRYFEDASGHKHPEFPMVTTVYILPKEGRDILYADPFLFKGIQHTIKGPDDLQFIPENIDASASTIFLIGKNETGEIQMYTRLADFDTLGHNPALPGFYFKSRAGSTTWKKQPPILLEESSEVSNKITIYQTGEGNSKRTLCVEGKNKEGVQGYFSKEINDNYWKFYSLP